jgi:hypothetical protein
LCRTWFPDVPPLRRNPVFLYFQDNFQRPNPFRPDVTVIIDDVFDKKVAAFDAHVSQFYEWLPWVDGRLDQVPKDPEERRKWVASQRVRPISPATLATLTKWYGEDRAKQARYVESFELCEYGRRPTITKFDDSSRCLEDGREVTENGRCAICRRSMKSSRDLSDLDAPRSLIVDETRRVLAATRAALLDQRAADPASIEEQVRANLAALAQPSLRRVINATGVILHTNLGRAPSVALRRSLLLESRIRSRLRSPRQARLAHRSAARTPHRQAGNRRQQ